MARVPSAVWIVDTKKEHLAVDEARKLGIPIVAILDTNCDPDEVDYKIPGNDDAIRSVTLLTRVVADAVAEGLLSRHRGNENNNGNGNGTAVAEPLAEWERELLEGQTAAVPAAEAVATEGTAAETSATEAAPIVEPEIATGPTAPDEPAETVAESIEADAPEAEPAVEAKA